MAPRLSRTRAVALAATLLLGLNSCTSPAWEVTFYVSPEGDDAWSGRFAEPGGTEDGPLRTLERARDAARALRKTDDRQIVIHLLPGTYRLTSSVSLGPDDSGVASAPVIWTSRSGEEAVISGSLVVSAFNPIDDEVASRLAEKVRAEVVEIDLASVGVTDFGTFSDRDGPGLELFFNGERMTRARYPNEGWIRIADVPQHGDSLIHEGSFQWTRDGIAVGRHFGAIRFDDERIAGWATAEDVWMHGYFVWDWRDGFQEVGSIDATTGVVRPTGPFHLYGFSEGQPVYFFNVLEEIDRPGEWVIDRSKAVVYFWPPSDPNQAEVSISVLQDPLIAVDSAAHIVIENLVLEETRGPAVVVSGGERVTIAGNTIRNTGQTAIEIDGGSYHRVQSNDLYDLGASGVRVHGGERVGLIPGHHEVVNNHIYRFSQIRKTSVPGIRVTGVANRIAHNLLHDSPDAGIFFFGNDLLLEYNELHNIAKESDDVGAFYIGRDYSMRGNVVRFNYVHDIAKPMHVGVMGVYLDDFTSGVTVHGNVFENAGRCVFMGGGRRNVVTNNIFVGCTPAVFLDARGKVRNTEFFDGTITVLEDRLAAVNALEPPYTERYPELVDLYDDDPAMPKYNVIRDNVVFEGTFLGLYSGLPLSLLDLAGNTIATDILIQTSPETGVETEDYQTFRRDSKGTVADLEARGNRVLVSDSDADDRKNWPEGFRPVARDSMGLTLDQYRRHVGG